MFDYEKFENDVLEQITDVFNMWMEENDDIYIISLDCTREMDSIGAVANTMQYLEEQAEGDSEDYWYYKYCEEEWDLFENFETVSADMGKYIDDNSDIFTDSETYEYLEPFDRHCDKIIECCTNVLVRFRQSMGESHSNILLALNIREYLDGEERIEIFEKVNSREALKEYSENIEEFV